MLSQAILDTPGLSAYWPLGSNESTALEVSGAGTPLTGTYTGAIPRGPIILPSGEPNQPGDPYGSTYFDGSGDYMSVADNSRLDATASGLTVMAWIQPTALPANAAWATVWSKIQAGTSEYWFQLYDDTGGLEHGYTTGGTSVLPSSNNDYGQFLANVPYHVAVAYKADNTADLFVNGTLAWRVSGSVSISTSNTAAFYLGGWNGASDWFTGYIAHSAVFDRALAQADIVRIFEAGCERNVVDASLRRPDYDRAVRDRSDYNLVVAADSPLLRWKLDDLGPIPADGKVAADSSGAGNWGRYVGSPPLVDGPVGQATSFDGSTQYVSSSYSTFPTGTTRSFEAWVWRTDQSAAMAILSSASASNPIYLGLGSGNDTLVFGADDGSGVWANFTNSGVGTGAWRHVVVVFDDAGNRVDAYVDGVALTPVTGYTGAFNASPGTFKVGASYSTTAAAWKGMIADVSIYSQALSAARVKAHYDAGKRQLGPLHLWSMSDTDTRDGVSITDSIGAITMEATGPNGVGRGMPSAQPGPPGTNLNSIVIGRGHGWGWTYDDADTLTATYTVECVVRGKELTSANWRAFADKGGSPGGTYRRSWLIGYNNETPGKLMWSVGTAGSSGTSFADITMAAHTTPGLWYHVVGVAGSGAGTTTELWVNGQQIGTSTATGGPYVALADEAYIGIGTGHWDTLFCEVAHFAFYGYCLSGPQIQAHHRLLMAGLKEPSRLLARDVRLLSNTGSLNSLGMESGEAALESWIAERPDAPPDRVVAQAVQRAAVM